MAENINLVTYAGSLVTPQHDAVARNCAILNNGIIFGCAISIKNSTTLHINAGMGLIYGRQFEIFDSDIPISLSESGDLLGQLYIHIDLSNTTEPIKLMTEAAASLTELVDNPNVNVSSGITEMQLATFTVGTAAISNLVTTVEEVGNVREEIAAINQNLTEKVAQHSDATYQIVKGLGYDATNKKLGLVIEEGGADSVIPFSGGIPFIFLATSSGNLSYTYAVMGVNTDGSHYSSLNSSGISNCDFATVQGNINQNVTFTALEAGTYILNGYTYVLAAGESRSQDYTDVGYCFMKIS